MIFSCSRPRSRVAKLAFLGFPLFLLIVFTAGMASGAPAVGSWSTTGSLNFARDVHTATLLPNGKVLVVGGYNSATNTSLNSAELYDPAKKTWTAIDSPATGRDSHTATLLHNGKVLVVGGYNNTSGTSLKSAELYDPAKKTWTVTGSLTTARDSHTATLLLDGKVLVAGGYGASGFLTSAELYDPVEATWTVIGSLNTARATHSATLLPTFFGRVVVVGGSNSDDALKSLEIYHPDTGDWSDTPESGPFTARCTHTATLLGNGQVLVAGGFDWDSGGPLVLDSVELSDRYGDFWLPTGALNTARCEFTATLLPNGQVLVAGGFDDLGALRVSASAELFDSFRATWQPTGSLTTARSDHTATLLPNGQVLVVGGWADSCTLASAELYNSPGATGVPMLNLLLLD